MPSGPFLVSRTGAVVLTPVREKSITSPAEPTCIYFSESTGRMASNQISGAGHKAASLADTNLDWLRTRGSFLKNKPVFDAYVTTCGDMRGP